MFETKKHDSEKFFICLTHENLYSDVLQPLCLVHLLELWACVDCLGILRLKGFCVHSSLGALLLVCCKITVLFWIEQKGCKVQAHCIILVVHTTLTSKLEKVVYWNHLVCLSSVQITQGALSQNVLLPLLMVHFVTRMYYYYYYIVRANSQNLLKLFMQTLGHMICTICNCACNLDHDLVLLCNKLLTLSSHAVTAQKKPLSTR